MSDQNPNNQEAHPDYPFEPRTPERFFEYLAEKIKEERVAITKYKIKKAIIASGENLTEEEMERKITFIYTELKSQKT